MDISSAPSYLPSPSPELFLFLRAYIEKVLCSFIFAGTFRNYQKLLLKCTFTSYFPADIYLLRFNSGNTRTMCEIGSKLTIKTQERLSIVDFDQVNAA